MFSVNGKTVRTNSKNGNASVVNSFQKVVNNIASPVKEFVSETTKKLTPENKPKNAPKNTSTQTSGVFKKIRETFQNNDTFATRMMFIIALIVLFGFVMHFITLLVARFMSPRDELTVVNGVRETNNEKKYNVNPNKGDPYPVLRSINENQGIEFTWSTWVWIEDISSGNSSPKRIFSKGKPVDTTGGGEGNDVYFMNNGPGMYLYDAEQGTSLTNSISIVMGLFRNNEGGETKPYDVISIPNMPMQKWVNIIIVGHGNTLDVYVNGVIKRRKEYDEVLRQNYGDIYVGQSRDGMKGYISTLKYYDRALDVGSIQQILYNGPLLTMEGEMWKNPDAPYLSTRWYMDS